MNKDLVQYAGLPAPAFAECMEDLKVHLRKHESSEGITKRLQTDYVKHHFEDGVYGRELFIPKDVAIISRVHKAGSINVLSKGSVIIIDTNGYRKVSAPHTFTSPVGTQRIVKALEDTVWTGVHHSACTNPEGLFEELTCETYDEFLHQLEDKQCGQQQQ